MNSSSVRGEEGECRNVQKVHLYSTCEFIGSREIHKHWYFHEDKDFIFVWSPFLRLYLVSRLPSPSEVISNSLLYNLKDTGSHVKRKIASMKPSNSFGQLPAETEQLGLSAPLRLCPKKITSLACNI